MQGIDVEIEGSCMINLRADLTQTNQASSILHSCQVSEPCLSNADAVQKWNTILNMAHELCVLHMERVFTGACGLHYPIPPHGEARSSPQ